MENEKCNYMITLYPSHSRASASDSSGELCDLKDEAVSRLELDTRSAEIARELSPTVMYAYNERNHPAHLFLRPEHRRFNLNH